MLVAISQFNGKVESEEVLKPVEKLISEAYQEIDKAVVKGVLHANTGANRKSRMALAEATAAGLSRAVHPQHLTGTAEGVAAADPNTLEIFAFDRAALAKASCPA